MLCLLRYKSNICSHHPSARRIRSPGRIVFVGAAFPTSELINSKSRQTFGGRSAADGRLSGTNVIQIVTCNQAANGCVVNASAPRPLVFLSSDAQAEENPKATRT
ncbi:hypothetical protein BD310DRAFT_359432 [Dichomitus squalens]|uniref:Uncharacterized protein n=1 Tax=Dichomitus squalens TaxID=114155 RepID=A0A4Q9PZ33_9APHY|nr:hypothetical protein BD310DRAFT_359432 [Dichomitus squalens]